MQDRVLIAERRVQVLEEKLDDAREKLITEKDKWAEYMAVISNHPPISGGREWIEQNRAAMREHHGKVTEAQETLMRTVRQNQLAREKAKAEFEQQLPEFVDEKYREAEQKRQEYFQINAQDLQSFFNDELATVEMENINASS